MPTHYEVDIASDLLRSINTLGILDVKRAAEHLNEAGICFDDFADYYKEYLQDMGFDHKSTPDICAIALDYILQEARREIEDQTNVDILNDFEADIWVYGNYYCSSFEVNNIEPVIELINTIEEPEAVIEYFVHMIS